MSLRLCVRAFVFDMDDTVNRTSEAMDAGLRAAVGAVWPGLSPELLTGAVDRYVRDDARWFERFSSGRIDFPTMRRGRLDEMAHWLGSDIDEDGFHRFERCYRDVFEGSCRAHEDALRLIERAGAAGVPLGVLSNSAEQMTRMKLRRLGLEHHFAVVLSCDQLAAGKPDRQAYSAMCSALACVPDQVGYVDDLHRDAVGALQAGLQSVWLDRLGAATPSGGQPQLPAPARVLCLDQIELEPIRAR